MEISTNVMQHVCCSDPHLLAVTLPSLQAACDKYEINTPRRMAAFLANIGVESGGLARLEENLNYSAQRLAAVWPKRFSTDGSGHVPNAEALDIQHNPEKIGNAVYSGRLGNGDGEGYEYRGRGFLQCTGKTNYEIVGKVIGIDLVSEPEKLSTIPVAAEAAAAQFMALCKDDADRGDINAVVKAINGQPPCAANGGQTRIVAFETALRLMGIENHQPIISGNDGAQENDGVQGSDGTQENVNVNQSVETVSNDSAGLQDAQSDGGAQDATATSSGRKASQKK